MAISIPSGSVAPPTGAPSLTVGDEIAVIVKGDLPTPAAGVITLLAGKVYRFYSSVDLGTDRLACTGVCTIHGSDNFVVTLETTHASPMLAVTGSLHVEDITLKNDAGPAIAYTADTGGDVELDIVDIISVGVDTFDGGAAGGDILLRNSRWHDSAQGCSIGGSCKVIEVIGVSFENMGSTATMLGFLAGTTAEVISITNSFFLGDNAGQTDLDFASAILPTAEGEVALNVFGGPGNHVNGAIDQTTVGWWFTNNPGIEDSAAIGVIDYKGNSTPTVITNGTSWHAITGSTFALDALSERFDEPAEGQLRYTGKEPKRMSVFIEMTAETAANNKLCNVRLRKYDASATTTSTAHEFDIDIRNTAQPIPQAHSYVVDLQQNDYLFIEIGSNDGTNMTILEANLMMSVA